MRRLVRGGGIILAQQIIHYEYLVNMQYEIFSEGSFQGSIHLGSI